MYAAKVLRVLGWAIIGSSITIAVLLLFLFAYLGYDDVRTEREVGIDYPSFGYSVLEGLAFGSVALLAGVILGAPLLAVAANMGQRTPTS